VAHAGSGRDTGGERLFNPVDRVIQPRLRFICRIGAALMLAARPPVGHLHRTVTAYLAK